jgi:hypothetical protein
MELSAPTGLLDIMLPAPACIMGPGFDIVAWNETFTRSWHPETLPPGRCNVIWMAFCEPGRRKTWTNWEERARTLLAEFRAAAGEHAGDPRFAELIADLQAHSAEFRSWWTSYEVRQSITGRLKTRIPGTGTIHMDVLDLQVCSHPSLRLSVQTPVRPSDHKRLVDLMAPSPRTASCAEGGCGPLAALKLRALPCPASVALVLSAEPERPTRQEFPLLARRIGPGIIGELPRAGAWRLGCRAGSGCNGTPRSGGFGCDRRGWWR